MEVLADLVIAAVFKTVGPYEKHAVGGFDSHALPLPDESSSRRRGDLTCCRKLAD